MEHHNFLLDPDAIVFVRFSQWFFVLVVPVITLIFIFACAQAFKTYGRCSFDVGVLFLCFTINVVFILEEFLRCNESFAILSGILQSSIIICLFYKFNSVIPNELRCFPKVITVGLVALTALLLVFLFIDATEYVYMQTSSLGRNQWVILRGLDFLFSLLVFNQCVRIESYLNRKDGLLQQKGYQLESITSEALDMRRE